MRTLAHTHTAGALESCYTPETEWQMNCPSYFAHGWIHIHSLYQLPNTKVLVPVPLLPLLGMLKATHGCCAILEYTKDTRQFSRVDFCTCKERKSREKKVAADYVLQMQPVSNATSCNFNSFQFEI
jgi:hypothetical protein